MTRTNKDSGWRGLSKWSTRGLDILNFLMADVRDGVGPFLSVYLKGSQHWGASDIGIAESTVKVHRTHLMRKMKARSLPELSRMADTLNVRLQQPQNS